MQRDRTPCNATRRDGARCGATVVLASGYCPMHDPAKQEQLQSIRAAGGHSKSRSARAAKLLPASLRPLLATLLAAVDEVHAGALAPQQATAMAALAGAVVKTYTSGQLEERLQVLEAAAAERRTA